jgi:hypothetical protein
MPHYWRSEHFDAFTYAYALETLMNDHPKVMWISFGDTDEWAHSRKYDLYLDAAHYTDAFIRDLYEACESDKFYRGRTTYLITCDHGRGFGNEWENHGRSTKGSEATWFMAWGKGVQALGEAHDGGPFYTKQFAATIAKVLGIDFTPDNGVKQEAIDPHYKGEPLVDFIPQIEYGTFEAVNASPKGKGVRYTYHEGEVKSVDELSSLPVLQSGVLPDFLVDGAKVEEYFGFQYKSLIRIDNAGRYHFFCKSDDGSKVWLDGQQIIDNDGSHGSNTEEAFFTLEKGYHRLEVKFFQKTAGKTLQLSWVTPEGAEVPLPKDILYYE